MKAVAIVSGGLDSVTLAYYLKDKGYDLHLLSFDYGQRHKKELEFARRCADNLGADFDLVDLSGMRHLFAGSALTDNIEVPDGHYASPNMAITIVPNRNAVMLAFAYAVAVSKNASAVAIGVHSGDHPVYPDCRPEFINAFEAAEILATGINIKLLVPFIGATKADIVTIGASIGVNYSNTWSCYRGLELHCGTCGTCIERIEAFNLANVQDPTYYMRKP